MLIPAVNYEAHARVSGVEKSCGDFNIDLISHFN